MGVSQAGRKKRPQPVAGLDAASVVARREKNRQAQHVFRKRKQATEAAQVQRIRRLEDVVEEMSCVVIGVFDAILETEHLTTGYPSLVSCLDGALARILELAKEVVNADTESHADGGEVPGLAISGSSSGSSTRQDDEEDNLELNVIDDDLQMAQMYMQTALDIPFPEALPYTSSSTMIDDASFFTSPQLYAMEPSDLPPKNWKATQAMIPPQIFGNNWSTKVTPGPTDGIILPPTTLEFQARLRDLGSFTQRLTENIISHGYASLTNMSTVSATMANTEVNRAFGYTLRFRTKEQISDALQWYLGPGREYLYRASGFTWGGKGGTRAEFPAVFGKKPKMRDLLSEDRLLEGHLDAEPDFLTAVGVYEELKKLGAKLVNDDIIEIRIGRQSSSPNDGGGLGVVQESAFTTSPSVQAWMKKSPDDFSSSSPSSGNPFGFMLKHRREQQLTLRLNITLLISNVTRRSVCFVRGPAFPRHEFGEVVQSSIVMAQWS